MSGIKHDHDKLPWHLLPGDALEEVVKVLEFGQRKYAARNWEYGMSWHRPFAAACRHMWAWWRGEDNDPETGLSHMAHFVCCGLFLLAFVLRKAGHDDRPIHLETLPCPSPSPGATQPSVRSSPARIVTMRLKLRSG